MLFIKFIPNFFSAIKIAKKILQNNRNTRGNAWGKYTADRFLDIWYANESKLPLRRGGQHFYEKRFDSLNSRHWMTVIDSELANYRLIEYFNSHRGYEAVKAIRNRRNRFIAWVSKFYLVWFMGDNPQYYKDMKEQADNLDS